MALDLPAYLQRIGAADAQRADLATLRRIALAHPLAIAFENLDAFRGVGVSLALEDVQRKLVSEGRGGWCFEHNLLLGEALRELGFTVHDRAARVLWGRDTATQSPRTHRLLEVQCDGRRWLVDGGFGGQTLTGILDMDQRDPQATPHEWFRLREFDGDLLLEALPTGAGTGAKANTDATASAGWRPLYRFDHAPQWPMDFEAANFQLARDPRSHFTKQLIAARPTESGRWSLNNRELTWRGLDGSEQRQRLADVAALQEALREHFGVRGERLAGLQEKFNGL
ncbi:MAG: arylamine N-acetyltransferase [Nevskiaceae bacterium]|jgi:N-hydroxyarylamine O-acetyltransferase|nr:arylamine N-acetyltransferase [Nevskiaceae bacterium]